MGTGATEAVIRPLDRPGDLGWVVQVHGEQYAAEFGWDVTFEALVARIVADYAVDRDTAREAAWIAELAGRRVGCVFCVANDADGADGADGANGADEPDEAETARLRILLVDPSARGHGLGRRLVDHCLDFARSAGYRRITLWTNDVLVSARRIYRAAGFELVAEERHRSFGHDLVGQSWSREL